MHFLKFSFILITVILLMGLKIDPLQSATDKSGLITAFDLEDRKMTIGETEYHLDDHLIIVSKNNISRGDGILENGQKIEFWVVYDPNTGQAIIKKIRVLSDIKIQS